MYEVRINGQTYRTFDAAYTRLVNQEGEFEYTSEERTSDRGNKYESKTLLPVKKTQQQQDRQALEKIYSLLQDMDSKLDKLLEPMSEESESDFVEDDGPNVEDIPF